MGSPAIVIVGSLMIACNPLFDEYCTVTIERACIYATNRPSASERQQLATLRPGASV